MLIKSLTRVAAFLIFATCNWAASAQDWQAGAGDDWKKLLAAAKQEGTVVVIGPPSVAQGFSEGFKRDTGINVEFLGIVGAPLTQRIVREYQSNSVTFDVAFTGATVFDLQKYMMPIRPSLILPGVTDPKNWIDGKLKFADLADTYIPDFAQAVFGWPVLNTDVVKADAVKSWNDLLKPEFKGKIAIYDPRVPGPGVSVAAFMADILGIDYMKKLYVDQNPQYTRDGRQLAEWVVRGVAQIGIGPDDAEISKFESAGVKNLKVMTDLEGGKLPYAGRFLPHAPASAPHKNAALVFMNWYASKQGQEANGAGQVVWSRRTDVNLNDLPTYIRPQPGKSYVDIYHEDWVVEKRNKMTDEVRALLGEK